MLLRQLYLQRVGTKLDPPAMLGEERGWYATWNHTALVKELGEALDELAWKPWSVDKDLFNREAFLKELVDAFHFLMNLVLLTGPPDAIDATVARDLATEFFDLYMNKSEINMRRFESGTYDAKSTKCPDCGRAIEDGERETQSDRQRVVEESWEERGQYVGDQSLFYSNAYRCLCGRLNHLEGPERAPTTS